jgi:hypothetical protein
MPASCFEMTHGELCVFLYLSVSSPSNWCFRPATPFDSYTLEIAPRKLLRITYFQRITDQYQNKRFQTPQGHILPRCLFITPLESHSSKKEGTGAGSEPRCPARQWGILPRQQSQTTGSVPKRSSHSPLATKRLRPYPLAVIKPRAPSAIQFCLHSSGCVEMGLL